MMRDYWNPIKAMRAAGYGILSGLGQAVSGIDAPTVGEPLEHALVGLAVALLVYAGPRRATDLRPIVGRLNIPEEG